MTQKVPLVYYGANNLAEIIGVAEVEITEVHLPYSLDDFVFGALVMKEIQRAPVPLEHPEDAIATSKDGRDNGPDVESPPGGSH